MVFWKVLLIVASSAVCCFAAKPPKPGTERDIEMANGVKIRFCWIPAGKATLGLKPGERTNLDTLDLDAYPFETKGFWLGKYEVTQEEWEGVMGVNPSHFRAGGEGAASVRGVKTNRFPVEMVSFEDCKKFIEASGVEGLRLPHEDEWEYACRGGRGNQRAFYFGDMATSLQFNFDGGYGYNTLQKGPYLARTTPVGSYAKVVPHPWGLCDMHGNVSEWCANLYVKDRDWRCLRGGSWNHPARAGRSAFRHGDYPSYKSQTIGVRFCLD
jgi:formylglycine-generating enzyme required for sulfatase activity